MCRSHVAIDLSRDAVLSAQVVVECFTYHPSVLLPSSYPNLLSLALSSQLSLLPSSIFYLWNFFPCFLFLHITWLCFYLSSSFLNCLCRDFFMFLPSCACYFLDILIPLYALCFGESITSFVPLHRALLLYPSTSFSSLPFSFYLHPPSPPCHIISSLTSFSLVFILCVLFTSTHLSCNLGHLSPSHAIKPRWTLTV